MECGWIDMKHAPKDVKILTREWTPPYRQKIMYWDAERGIFVSDEGGILLPYKPSGFKYTVDEGTRRK